MHIHTLEQWQHRHDFLADWHHAENNTKIVLGLTAITMLAEIVSGTLFGSMALLADGWHMATHVAAFSITVFAYHYARKHANNPKYTFGTGKVNVLGGFTSAIALAVVALIMALESSLRFFQPQTIQFDEAIYVAAIGLAVNLISALLLRDQPHFHDHAQHQDHGPADGHLASSSHHPDDHHHEVDHNLQAAYVHVLADALTSVLAMVALVAGKFLGWIWLDAVMGLVGALVIARWAYGLVRETGVILLDGTSNHQMQLAIVTAIQQDQDNRVTDLHVWHLSQTHLAATISLVTHVPHSPEYYKQLLSHLPALSHVLVEVNQCPGEPCINLHAPSLQK